MTRGSRLLGATAVVAFTGWVVAGCASGAGGGAGGAGGGAGGGGGGGDPCVAQSLSLEVLPPAVDRGVAADLSVTWRTTWGVYDPARVVLSAGVEDAQQLGSVAVEVEAPLGGPSFDVDPGARYDAVVANPFGAGAPAGLVSLLASSGTRPELGCNAAVTATTSLQLR